MAAQEALQHLVKKELEVKGTGVRKRRNEAGEPPLGTADFHLSEMRPVDLSLITRKGAQAQKSFAATGAQVSNSAPEGIDTARVAAHLEHLEYPRGAQPWTACESLPDEVGIGILQCAAGDTAAETICLHRPAYGVVMQSELTGDRADLPVFGVEQMPDLSYGFLRNHSSPQSQRRDRPNVPDGHKSGKWGERADRRLAERDCIRPLPAQSMPVSGDCQKGSGYGKVDPSRNLLPLLPGVACRPADGLDDQLFPQDSADDGGSRLAVVPGELWRGTDRCSSAARGHSGGKSKTERRNRVRRTISDGEHLQLLVPSSPEGETGHQPSIVAALSRLARQLSQESLRHLPRSVTRPGSPLLDLRKQTTRKRRCLDDGPHACGADDAGAIYLGKCSEKCGSRWWLTQGPYCGRTSDLAQCIGGR